MNNEQQESVSSQKSVLSNFYLYAIALSLAAFLAACAILLYINEISYKSQVDHFLFEIEGKVDSSELLIVQDLLQSVVESKNVNVKNTLGITPLMLSAEYDNVDFTKWLLRKGAYIDATDNASETALMRAIRHNSVRVADLLIQNGSDVSIRNTEGENILHISYLYSDEATQEMLNKHDLFENTDATFFSSELLELAFEQQNLELFKKLLTKDVDPDRVAWTLERAMNSDLYNTKDWERIYFRNVKHENEELEKNYLNGELPLLSLAYLLDDKRYYQSLLDLSEGINVNVLMPDRNLLIYHVLINEHNKIGFDQVGEYPETKKLIDLGADIDFNYEEYRVSRDFVVYLMEVAGDQFIETINTNGVHAVNNRDRNGDSLLHNAMEKWLEDTDQKAIIKRLLEQGADPNIRDGYGMPAIVYTTISDQRTMEEKEEMVDLFLKHGAYLDISLEGEPFAFSLSCLKGTKYIKMAEDKGVDFTQKSFYQQTAIHHAARCKNKDAILYFIDKGIDVAFVDVEGYTALSFMASHSNPEYEQDSNYSYSEVAKLLIENGANDVELAFLEAIRNGNTELMDLFINPDKSFLNRVLLMAIDSDHLYFDDLKNVAQYLTSKGADNIEEAIKKIENIDPVTIKEKKALEYLTSLSNDD